MPVLQAVAVPQGPTLEQITWILDAVAPAQAIEHRPFRKEEQIVFAELLDTIHDDSDSDSVAESSPRMDTRADAHKRPAPVSHWQHLAAGLKRARTNGA